MNHQLSFAQIKIHSNNIAEVMVNDGVEITLAMVDEYDEFLMHHFKNKFGLLINKINRYAYTYEAKLSIASLDNICAMAVINYHYQASDSTNRLKNLRVNDNWNLKEFSGLELGYQQGLQWLKQQLVSI